MDKESKHDVTPELTPAASAVSEKGIAHIKKEFVLIPVKKVDVDVAVIKPEIPEENSDDQPPACKKSKREERKRARGQNKSRGVPWRADPSKQMCNSLIAVSEGEPWPNCNKNKCLAMHDIKEYLSIKPADLGESCYMYRTYGRCPRGLACRFGSEHVTPEGYNKVDKEKFNPDRKPSSFNNLDKDLQNDLRKYKYDFNKSEKICNDLKAKLSKDDDQDKVKSTDVKPLGPVPDDDLIPFQIDEKHKISWKDKLYLSPLTTLGNLPFRRICKTFGADITCGEMAVATSILQGQPQEWALVRRHESEDLFGVQICGSNPFTMSKCAQILQEKTQLDFIDINMGCPIDLIYQQGAGSALLKRQNILHHMVKSMSQVMTIPLTIKTRTGVYTDKRLAHSLIPKMKNWGVAMITLHGRSREQRYTKSADWSYIDECAQLADPIPLYGNGDILSYDDYKKHREMCKHLSGVMIGRGALIKPWIFTEIKEQRHWDISSGERLDILKKFANFGLEHWGSDDKGVENTRRFLLEWLSFLYRYIPYGLLEVPPQNINERPPLYKGRDDLETLMASPNSADWVKISEMLLGPVPSGFNFLPKHKANAW